MATRKKNRGVIYEADASPEWYTPRALRELATMALRGIDLDPATCSENPLNAAHYLTAADGPPSADAWFAVLKRCMGEGERPSVWLNPPYGRETGRWLDQLSDLHALIPCNSLTLIPCRPGSRWYAHHTGPEGADLVCELKGRIAFDHRDASGAIVAGTEPARWACALLYRSGAPTTALDLAWVRRALARFGAVRLAGRQRRTRERRDWRRANPHGRPLRPRRLRPLDPRQLAMSWPDNVIPFQPRPTKGTTR